jgi:SAM-dependent methyltransferase
MAYLFQPDRYLLLKQIEKYSFYVHGTVLDMGAGEVDRYSSLFRKGKYIRMDVRHSDTVDIVGNADAIPLDDESVDSVVCTQVFEHLKEPFAAAKEIYRVLRRGGVVLITVPQMNELHEEPHDYFRYTKWGMQYIFETAGLTLLHMDKRGGFFSTSAQMFARYCIDRFDLYHKPLRRKLFAFPLQVIGRFSIWLDSKDTTPANEKHAIGWCFVFKK